MATLSGGRGWLSDAAAASLHRMDAAYGGRLPITSAGRSNSEQWDAWRKYQAGGPLAAYPGTSVHESGNACDFGSGAWGWLGSGYGLGWNGARANEYGWRRTVSSESWHYEYDAGRDRHRGESGGGADQDTKNRQEWLNRSRGEQLAVDGLEGPATIAAYKRYQEFLGVAADGIWGEGTQAAHQRYYDSFNASGGNSWPANALYGEAWVRSIQEKLNRLGYGLEVDGKDGPGTQNAVKDFQNKNGLPADGIAGPITNNKLDAVLTGNGGAPSDSLTVDGEWGAATTRKLQSVLGVGVDGEIGPQTIKALQSRLNVEADGLMGPATTRALQRVVGAADDGEMGPNTVRALQSYLNAGGNFQPSTTPGPTPTTPPASLTVDGDWGPATTRALQTKLKVTADGELGPQTWKTLQTALGVTADGEPGPQTYKALQTFLGVGVDGQIGPETVRSLQTFLNSNGDFHTVIIPPEPEKEDYPKPATATYPEAASWNHSPNSSPRRDGDKVEYFVIHHAADTSSVQNQINRFMRANDRNVSPNWLIGSDGSAHEIVPPDKFRAWTTGKFDYKAVTVETQNTSREPNWGISAESHERIAKLVAWASQRYGFPIDRQHVIGHREVPGVDPTACPGPSMDLDAIVTRAKLIALGTTAPTPTPTPEPTPEPEPTPTPQPGKEKWVIELDLDEAKEFAAFLDTWRKLLP